MKTKKEIVENWLVRYTGVDLNDFGKYILLTNFQHYVDLLQNLLMPKYKAEKEYE